MHDKNIKSYGNNQDIPNQAEQSKNESMQIKSYGDN